MRKVSITITVRFPAEIATWIRGGADVKSISVSRLLRTALYLSRDRHAGNPLPPSLAGRLMTATGPQAENLSVVVTEDLRDWLQECASYNGGVEIPVIVRGLALELYDDWRENPGAVEERLTAYLATLHYLDSQVVHDAPLSEEARRGLFEIQDLGD